MTKKKQSKPFKPVQLSTVGFLTGMQTSLIISLLSSYDSNAYLIWAIFSTGFSMILIVIYSLYIINKKKEAVAAVELKEENDTRALTEVEKSDVENSVWNQTKSLVYMLVLGMLFFAFIGIGSSFMWRDHINKEANSKHTELVKNIKTIEEQVRLISLEAKTIPLIANEISSTIPTSISQIESAIKMLSGDVKSLSSTVDDLNSKISSPAMQKNKSKTQ